MRCNVLMMFTDSDLRQQVEDLLEERIETVTFTFKGVADEVKAREILGNFNLIVAYLDITKDIGGQLGMRIAQWIDQENMNIPTVLLAAAVHEELEKIVNKQKKCELIILKKDIWDDLFVKRVNEWFGAKLEPKPKKRLDVDLFFRLDKQNMIQVEYAFRGEGHLEQTPLNIPLKDFLDLMESEYEALEQLEENGDNFQEELVKKLRVIGDELMDYFFKKDPEFSRRFWTRVSSVGGLSNTRIRFVVEKKVHPFALEAIYGPDEHEVANFWMLHTPIYRTVGKYAGWGVPLFQNPDTSDEPLDILIIKSLTEGTAYIREGELEWKIPLDCIKKVEDECSFLKNEIESPKYKNQVKMGKVEIVPIKGDKRPFMSQVRESLKKHWHIIHYAGHSYFDADTKKGYIFFPGGRDELGEMIIKVVALEEFCSWLLDANPNLVFLSSCHSSETGFVFELASKQIPAIIGFRWAIEDKMAAEYTKEFYRILFTEKQHSLEDVFLKTRQMMYENEEFRKNPIWAAPVLVMQSPAA